MGFLHMLAVNRELNQTVSGVQNKFHRLEDLINGHRGVDDRNFNEVNYFLSHFNSLFMISQNRHKQSVAIIMTDKTN